MLTGADKASTARGNLLRLEADTTVATAWAGRWELVSLYNSSAVLGQPPDSGAKSCVTSGVCLGVGLARCPVVTYAFLRSVRTQAPEQNSLSGKRERESEPKHHMVWKILFSGARMDHKGHINIVVV